MVNSKHAFWQALVFTVIVFGIGLSLGFLFELSRNNTVENTIYSSEISLLDQQLRAYSITSFNVSCDIAKQSLFEFADRIYEEASQLETYDGVSKFQNTLGILHRRYDLMRLLVWSESIDLKQRCNLPFHTAVYFYDYGTQDLKEKVVEGTFANILSDLKQAHGNDLLLIPIAANLNLTSVDVLLNSYNINSFPAILIDEKNKVSENTTYSELEQSIFSK